MTLNNVPIIKKLFFFSFLTLLILMIFINFNRCASGQVTRSSVLNRAQQFQKLLVEKELQGIDTTKALELDQKSREAMRNNNPMESLRLIDEAISILESSPSSKVVSAPIKGEERDFFYEIHMEPGTANKEMFEELKKFVKLADTYNIKLTLLFTPQWAEMILDDPEKTKIINSWKNEGHEIGGHHHGPNVWPWDGYSDLNSEEIDKVRAARPQIPVAQEVAKKEKYLGNMQSFMTLLNRLAGEKIKVITMSNEIQDWPDGVPYAAGGRHLVEALSIPRKVAFRGHQVVKVSSVTFKPGKIVEYNEEITLQQMKDKFLSSQPGIFGTVSHPEDYKKDPQMYENFFKFLHSIDQSGKHSKTVTQIIETHSQNQKT